MSRLKCSFCYSNQVSGVERAVAIVLLPNSVLCDMWLSVPSASSSWCRGGMSIVIVSFPGPTHLPLDKGMHITNTDSSLFFFCFLK